MDLTPEPGTDEAKKYEDINQAKKAVKRIEINDFFLRIEQSNLSVPVPEMSLQIADERDADPDDRLAWFTFPVLMGGFVAATAWGLARGYDPAPFGMTLVVVNFFVILGVEQVLPRNPAMNVFRDRQPLNDIGHGILLSAMGRPLGGALSVLLLAGLAQVRLLSDLASLWPGGWPFAAQLLLGLVIWTFMDYWIHRSLHTFERLWWFHSIHHDTPQMHILKSGRIHLGEELYNALLKPVPLLLLAGIAVRTVSLVLIPVLLGATFVHLGNGWVFSNANGGWEYPAFLTLAVIVQALLGPGKYAVEFPPKTQEVAA